METKHTKGEWKHHKNSNWVGIGSRCIAIAYRQSNKLKSTGELEDCEEMVANAKLIAAAPDLLEALGAAMKIISAYHFQYEEGEDVYKKCKEAIKKAVE